MTCDKKEKAKLKNPRRNELIELHDWDTEIWEGQYGSEVEYWEA